jgi:hypothetical protein
MRAEKNLGEKNRGEERRGEERECCFGCPYSRVASLYPTLRCPALPSRYNFETK